MQEYLYNENPEQVVQLGRGAGSISGDSVDGLRGELHEGKFSIFEVKIRGKEHTRLHPDWNPQLQPKQQAYSLSYGRGKSSPLDDQGLSLQKERIKQSHCSQAKRKCWNVSRRTDHHRQLHSLISRYLLRLPTVSQRHHFDHRWALVGQGLQQAQTNEVIQPWACWNAAQEHRGGSSGEHLFVPEAFFRFQAADSFLDQTMQERGEVVEKVYQRITAWEDWADIPKERVFGLRTETHWKLHQVWPFQGLLQCQELHPTGKRSLHQNRNHQGRYQKKNQGASGSRNQVFQPQEEGKLSLPEVQSG